MLDKLNSQSPRSSIYDVSPYLKSKKKAGARNIEKYSKLNNDLDCINNPFDFVTVEQR